MYFGIVDVFCTTHFKLKFVFVVFFCIQEHILKVFFDILEKYTRSVNNFRTKLFFDDIL